MRVFFVGLQNNRSHILKGTNFCRLVVILRFSGDSSTYPEKWENLNVKLSRMCLVYVTSVCCLVLF